MICRLYLNVLRIVISTLIVYNVRIIYQIFKRNNKSIPTFYIKLILAILQQF